MIEVLDFDTRLSRAAFVVIGEGNIDGPGFSGKITRQIITRCRRQNVRVHAVVGQNLLISDERAQLLASIRAAGNLEEIRWAAAEVAQTCQSPL